MRKSVAKNWPLRHLQPRQSTFSEVFSLQLLTDCLNASLFVCYTWPSRCNLYLYSCRGVILRVFDRHERSLGHVKDSICSDFLKTRNDAIAFPESATFVTLHAPVGSAPLVDPLQRPTAISPLGVRTLFRELSPKINDPQHGTKTKYKENSHAHRVTQS